MKRAYNSEDAAFMAERHDKSRIYVEQKLKELQQYRDSYLSRYIKIVSWLDENFDIQSFFPREPITKAESYKMYGYDADAKPQYQYKAVAISAELVVKYQLPYSESNWNGFKFKKPRKLYFKKAGAGTINNLHYLFDGNSFAGIGCETSHGQLIYHSVIIPYDIYYYWRKCWDAGTQTKLF